MGLDEFKKIDLLSRMDRNLYEWSIGDIRKNSDSMAGFILVCCLIEAVAGFYYGATKEDNGGVKCRFEKFVNDYLCKVDVRYNAQDLYSDLRCALVHAYAPAKTLAFTHLKEEAEHFEEKNGRIILRLDQFIEDVDSAYRMYRSDLEVNPKLLELAWKRFDSMGLMSSMDKDQL